MGALQEARFYVIIGVIMLVGILGYFFTLQNNVNYTDYSTAVKTNYADTKANGSSIKTVYDVITLDGTNFRGMKNNQLFGLVLDSTPATIQLLDNYDKATTTADEVNIALGFDSVAGTGTALTAGKFQVNYVTTEDVVDLTSVTTGTADVSPYADIAAINTANLAGTELTPQTKGWTLDGTGYIIYSFESATKAKDIMSNYLPTGKLYIDAASSPTSHVIVPFTSK